MANLTADRKTDRLGTDDVVWPQLLSIPVEASTILFGGGLVATNAAGNAIAAGTAGALRCWGRCERDTDNRTTGQGNPLPGFGSAGNINVTVKPGVYFFNNGTSADAIGASNVGQYCYAIDDNTVGLTDGGGTRPIVGVIMPAGTSNNLGTTGQIAVFVGQGSPYQTSTQAQVGTHYVRGVVTSNIASLASFTVASNDGLTYVQGQRVLLVNQTTLSQNGIYVVGVVTAGVAPLTRPLDWATGSVQQGGAVFVANEGTQGANSQWIVRTAGAVTVDTTNINIEMIQGNWVQGVSTAVGTMATPNGFFFVGATLKARLSGIFHVDVNVGYANNTTADPVTIALVTDTVADGAGAVLGSANKVNHGVTGFGTYGTRGADWESCDTNAGAAITFNSAAFSTAGVTQATEQAGTLTGLLTANGTSTQKFIFSGVVYNASPTGTTKTPFTIGNQCAFGIKVTAAAGTITVGSVRLTVTELPSQ